MGLVQQAFTGIAHHPALDAVAFHSTYDDQVDVQFGSDIPNDLGGFAFLEMYLLLWYVAVLCDIACIRRVVQVLERCNEMGV